MASDRFKNVKLGPGLRYEIIFEIASIAPLDHSSRVFVMRLCHETTISDRTNLHVKLLNGFNWFDILQVQIQTESRYIFCWCQYSL